MSEKIIIDPVFRNALTGLGKRSFDLIEFLSDGPKTYKDICKAGLIGTPTLLLPTGLINHYIDLSKEDRRSYFELTRLGREIFTSISKLMEISSVEAKINDQV